MATPSRDPRLVRPTSFVDKAEQVKTLSPVPTGECPSEPEANVASTLEAQVEEINGLLDYDLLYVTTPMVSEAFPECADRCSVHMAESLWLDAHQPLKPQLLRALKNFQQLVAEGIEALEQDLAKGGAQ